MAEKKHPRIKVKLGDLLVNSDNPRFEPVKDQKKAIRAMVNNQKNKLLKLAETILDEGGLHPLFPIAVTKYAKDPTKYVVGDGNRRVTVLKLLANPELIDSEFKFLQDKFKLLGESWLLKGIDEFECLLFIDEKNLNHWIKLIHTGLNKGAGVDKWNAAQKKRFLINTGENDFVEIQAMQLLETSKFTVPQIKKDLPKFKLDQSSNLERLLKDPKVREKIGIEWNKHKLNCIKTEKKVVRNLSKVVNSMLKPGFRVANIYYKTDRARFVNQAGIDLEVKKKVIKKTKSKRPTNRKYLIPDGFEIKISEAKIDNIFWELKSLDLLKFTNAVAVLFRVFVEHSTDFYLLDKHLVNNTPIKDGSGKIKKYIWSFSKLSGSKGKLSLKNKVNCVCDYLLKENPEHLGITSICKAVKSEINKEGGILSIATFHEYVHNFKFSPDAQSLVIAWDNIQEFIELLWIKTGKK